MRFLRILPNPVFCHYKNGKAVTSPIDRYARFLEQMSVKS